MNWFKKLFCKEECRRIESLDSNQVMAQYLSMTIEKGNLKEYKHAKQFIDLYKGETLLEPKYIKLKYLGNTPELIQLAKTAKHLSWKIKDVELQKKFAELINLN